jgi:hypothetical protein
MKVKPEDYDKMKTAVEKVMLENPNVTVETYLSQGLTAMRFRWDALIIASRKKLFDICALYSYCNDTHIDTALRRITGTK